MKLTLGAQRLGVKIADSAMLYLQLIMLIGAIFAPLLLNFGAVVSVKQPDGYNFYRLVEYYISQLGWPFTGILFSSVLLMALRKINASRVLNRGNRFHDRTMLEYWLASKVLGYGACNLMRVPIPTQFKLLLNDTFDNYDVGPDDYYQTPEDDDAKCESLVFKEVGDVASDVVNLLIADTYPIGIDQIPECVRTYETMCIKRTGTTQTSVRYYSPELVKCVTEVVRGLPNDTKLNLFATTNPKNTLDIACKVFKLGSRTNISELNVYRQECGAVENEWPFTKEVKIYHW